MKNNDCCLESVIDNVKMLPAFLEQNLLNEKKTNWNLDGFLAWLMFENGQGVRLDIEIYSQIFSLSFNKKII